MRKLREGGLLVVNAFIDASAGAASKNCCCRKGTACAKRRDRAVKRKVRIAKCLSPCSFALQPFLEFVCNGGDNNGP